jgi:excisionase family DNA binding protein
VQDEISSEWITYEDAQRLTSLGRTTLWRICSAEDSGIEVARVGRAVRISRSSLTAYMKRSAEESKSP